MTTQRISILFLTCCLALFTTNCAEEGYLFQNADAIKGEGDTTERILQLDDFTGIILTTSADVFLTQGNTQSVRVSAQENIIDNLETEVNNGVWKIKGKKPMRSYKPVNIYITIPDLSLAKISGSGDIEGQSAFRTDNEVNLGISGSGDIELEIEAPAIDAGMSGSGDIELEGKTNTFSISISGSGDIDAADLVSEDCEVRVSGSGDVKVHATEQLNVRVSGSGDVYYRGNPRVNSRISGSGDLHSM